MPAPIRIEWFNYPGVGEYGAWRVHGSHDGFDSYTRPKATIYGTADNGTVIGKGYVAGGWGHYIDVFYKATAFRKQYTQRDCHMHEASGLRVGAPVSTKTALGRVGRTGNAKNIFWIRNGVELWHVHSEIYMGVRGFSARHRTNPLPVWGATTAGGGVTPVVPEPTVLRRKSMSTIYFITSDDKPDGNRGLHALAGDSPGTQANFLETRNAERIGGWTKAHGEPVWMSQANYKVYRDLYQTPLVANSGGVTGSGGGATKADVDAAAQSVIDALPTRLIGTLGKE